MMLYFSPLISVLENTKLSYMHAEIKITTLYILYLEQYR